MGAGQISSIRNPLILAKATDTGSGERSAPLRVAFGMDREPGSLFFRIPKRSWLRLAGLERFR